MVRQHLNNENNKEEPKISYEKRANEAKVKKAKKKNKKGEKNEE